MSDAPNYRLFCCPNIEMAEKNLAEMTKALEILRQRDTKAIVDYPSMYLCIKEYREPDDIFEYDWHIVIDFEDINDEMMFRLSYGNNVGFIVDMLQYVRNEGVIWLE